jgi:hypothetical protein
MSIEVDTNERTADVHDRLIRSTGSWFALNQGTTLIPMDLVVFADGGINHDRRAHACN